MIVSVNCNDVILPVVNKKIFTENLWLGRFKGTIWTRFVDFNKDNI